jgi:hypothetical protein
MAIHEKITKLLALAGNNPNRAEAFAALQKAREIMAMHGITEQDMDTEASAAVPETAIDDVLMAGSGALEKWYQGLATVVADAFRCVAYLNRTGRKQEIRVIGCPDDVAVVHQVYAFTRQAASKLCYAYLRGLTDPPSGKDADGYYVGFLAGLRQAFTEQTASHPEWGLVLAKPGVVRARANELNLVPGRGRWRFHAHGYSQGHRDGYDVGKRDRVQRV